ncbi:MAG TPA: Holliday junction branch migration protein RuvA [Sphingobacteriaceae bacterium]|nr:Holliday junction branch migration protein RuvA [Sphingobacteriaceae bacterium]
MIERLVGELHTLAGEEAVVMVGGVGYGVLLPPVAAEALVPRVGETVRLYTHYYLQGGVGSVSLTPTLIGFLQSEEREFYRLLLQVSGLGPRGALRAFSRPPAAIAQAIAAGDKAFLQQLPGVGAQRAAAIIQQLQDKVAAFLPVVEAGAGPAPQAAGVPGAAGANGVPGLPAEVVDEVLAVLEQLGYQQREAQRMVAAAGARLEGPATAENVIQAIFRRAKGGVGS